jgi:hypothetical protein
VESESGTSVAFRVGSVFLALRKRTRAYDGRGAGIGSPGVQIAFLMSPAEVDLCHQEIVDKGVPILDPPKDQPWGHRTLYFSDPEGNILEIYAMFSAAFLILISASYFTAPHLRICSFPGKNDIPAVCKLGREPRIHPGNGNICLDASLRGHAATTNHRN